MKPLTLVLSSTIFLAQSCTTAADLSCDAVMSQSADLLAGLQKKLTRTEWQLTRLGLALTHREGFFGGAK